MNHYNNILLNDLSQNLIDEQGNPPTAANLNKTEAALIAFAELHSAKPPLSMRDKIIGNLQKLTLLKNTQQPFTLDNLPLLTPDSNYLDWEATIKGIEPAEDYEDIYLHLLEDNDYRELHVLWVKQIVPEEVHHDVLESFILIEGTCECHISNEKGETRIVKMREGDYIAFKIGEVHDIHITSSQPAKGILQWLKRAA